MKTDFGATFPSKTDDKGGNEWKVFLALGSKMKTGFGAIFPFESDEKGADFLKLFVTPRVKNGKVTLTPFCLDFQRELV